MPTHPEKSTQKAVGKIQNKHTPPNLLIVFGFILGIAAGYATGHLLWTGLFALWGFHPGCGAKNMSTKA